MECESNIENGAETPNIKKERSLDYKQNAKLNRYITLALVVTYKIKNATVKNDFFTLGQISNPIINRRFKRKKRDQEMEPDGVDGDNSQLKICETMTDKQLEKEFFLKGRFRKWNKIIDNLDNVQKTMNDNLERTYRIAQSVGDKTMVKNLTDFLNMNKMNIFNKAQLVDLLSRFPDEVKNPVKKAENYKQRHDIEFFSKKDMRRAILIILEEKGYC